VLADLFNLKEAIYEENLSVFHRHHIDFNKTNNNPSNITRMSVADHLELHRKHAASTLHTPEAKAKAIAAHQTDEYRKLMSSKMSQAKYLNLLHARNNIQWNDPVYVN